jgi:mono/diheme cytochrome c family protein
LEAQADPRPESKAFVGAFDPITGQYKWRHQLESLYNGGVLATTTGLLFQGEGTGNLVVRDSDTGEPILSYDAQGTFGSSVMTYQIGDTQYVAVLMNGNRTIDLGGSVVVLKLDGEAALPTATVIEPAEVPEQPDDEYSEQLVTQGNELYHAQCASCHGGIGIPNEVAITAPELRLMTLDTHADFENIVINGARAERGMPDFEDALSSVQLEAIRAFIVTQARQLRENQ